MSVLAERITPQDISISLAYDEKLMVEIVHTQQGTQDDKLINHRNGYLVSSNSNLQQGFTLVELLIALVLGLLISAAALQIFYTSSVNARRQQAGSQIQDNAIFGLTDLELRLRRVNYGAQPNGAKNQYYMNHLTPQGGVVLTAPTAPTSAQPGWSRGNLYGLNLEGAAINANLLSVNAATGSASNLSGTDVANSDQLTIQYQAGLEGMFDCQGRAIPKDYYVIERYFVRSDATVSPAQNGLACASAIYKYDATLAGSATGIDIKEFTPPGVGATAKPNNLAGNGIIVIPNVDYFRVLLGISSSDDFAVRPENASVAYIPIPANLTALNNRRIVGVQVGLLTHSDNPTATAQTNSSLRFSILDKLDKPLKSTVQSGPTYLRNVYETTVLFRNARGGV